MTLFIFLALLFGFGGATYLLLGPWRPLLTPEGDFGGVDTLYGAGIWLMTGAAFSMLLFLLMAVAAFALS